MDKIVANERGDSVSRMHLNPARNVLLETFPDPLHLTPAEIQENL
jgi:hypothetical protein